MTTGNDRRSQTDQQRQLWEKQAPRYDRQMRLWERLLFPDGRAWVCQQAHGDVLEVAIGTGRNLPHYPAEVRLTGIDLSPAMLAIARGRAGRLGREITLREGDAHALPFTGASFDTVVCTLSLCNIPDDRKAIAEMHRVLRPGGRLLLLDHVRSTSRWILTAQRLLERVSVRFGGDHLTRRPLDHVTAQGFKVERAERSKRGIVERVAAGKPRSTKL